MRARLATITAAPTTSTTMMAALGDALAVVLLRRRGFAAADFHVFHPGGALGSALLDGGRGDALGREAAAGAAEASVAVAILEMTSKGFGCTGVADGEREPARHHHRWRSAPAHGRRAAAAAGGEVMTQRRAPSRSTRCSARRCGG